MTSLVIQTSFLGDMVLTTPLLEALAKHGPVDVVATPAAAPLLVGHCAVRDVIVYDKRGVARGWRGLFRTARAIRYRADGSARQVEAAYLAQGSVRSAALAVLAGVSRRVGFDRSAGRWLYSERVRYDSSAHHARRLLQLAIGSSVLDASLPPRPTLFPSAADQALVDSLLASAGVPAGRPLIVLAPGSVWATKRWPHFPALAAALQELDAGREAHIVVMGAAVDGAQGRAIAEALQQIGAPLPVDATGRLPLLASAALLARANVLVTNDSLPLHLGSAMNTPTVALFGPTTPSLGFGPLSERSSVLGVDGLECRPCHAHGPVECPLSHWRCMRELTAQRVADEVVRMMQPTR